jgi:hypothetical protein
MLTAVTLAVALCGWGSLRADDLVEPGAIGVIKGPSLEQAKIQALAWLQAVQAAPGVLERVEALWDPAAERSLLDRVVDTLTLADPDAQKLIADVRNPSTAAPMTVPELLKDPARSNFYRSNLGLAYAREWSIRRVHEESLEALKAIRPEHVVDPASYYFFKAVAEHKLRLKDEGLETVDRLLSSIPDAPERYVVVATLMKYEMKAWKDDDLGDIARRMDGIERRLDLARGGPETQKQQKEVVDRLTKMIEELEKQC